MQLGRISDSLRAVEERFSSDSRLDDDDDDDNNNNDMISP
jgi:hypothetical protein